jgi:hypothetical protein
MVCCAGIRSLNEREHSDPIRLAPDFYLGTSVVGFFKDHQLPTSDGNFRYEPYRGAGHYILHTELRKSKMPRCFYQTNERRVFFTVTACPSYGVLSLTGFEAA